MKILATEIKDVSMNAYVKDSEFVHECKVTVTEKGYEIRDALGLHGCQIAIRLDFLRCSLKGDILFYERRDTPTH